MIYNVKLARNKEKEIENATKIEDSINMSMSIMGEKVKKLLRVGINVAAYQIGVLDKVTNIFYFSGKTNVDADHERCNRDYFSALKISPFNEINF